MAPSVAGAGSEPSPSRHAGAVTAVVALAALALGVGPVAGPSAALPAGPLQVGPTANLTVSPNPAHPGDVVVLDARDSTAPNASIDSCAFDVDGDGGYELRSADCVVESTYEQVGEYEPSVRVRTAQGETATDTATLVVRENDRPTAAIEVDPAAPLPGEAVTLSAAASTDPDGVLVAYRWRVAGQTLDGETVTRTFETDGEYAVGLEVIDDDGAAATAATTITVRANTPPTARLTVQSASPTVGAPVRLDAGGSRDAEGGIVAYRWDLDGDGTVDRRTTAASLTFEPTAPGERSIAVTVVDGHGATDTARAQLAVAPATTATAAPTATPASAGTGALPSLEILALLGLLVLLVGGAGLGLRSRAAVADRLDRLRDLLTRGDVRRNLARKLSATAVKTAAKRAIRRFSDLIEAGGDAVGEAFERLGRGIKRGSERVAAWLRRLGS